MLSRLVVRTVLALFIGLLSYAVWLTWQHQFENIGQKGTLFLVESGVLLAAASLLVESFRPFSDIYINKKSWKSFFFMYDAYEDGQTARTCELFALRSVFLAMMGLITAAFAFLFWEAVKFLLNPHPVAINWVEIGKVTVLVLAGLAGAGTVIAVFEWLLKKVTDKSLILQCIVSGLYWMTAISILFGVIAVMMIKDQKLAAMPFYWAFLYTFGLVFLILACLGVVVALGYGLFRLAVNMILRLSAKYPMLAEVYNTICPVQIIHFVE